MAKLTRSIEVHKVSRFGCKKQQGTSLTTGFVAVCHINVISVLVCTLPDCEANGVPVPVATKD